MRILTKTIWQHLKIRKRKWKLEKWKRKRKRKDQEPNLRLRPLRQGLRISAAAVARGPQNSLDRRQRRVRAEAAKKVQVQVIDEELLGWLNAGSLVTVDEEEEEDRKPASAANFTSPSPQTTSPKR